MTFTPHSRRRRFTALKVGGIAVGGFVFLLVWIVSALAGLAVANFSKEVTGTVEEETRLQAEAAELQRKLRMNRLMRGDALSKIEKDVVSAREQADDISTDRMYGGPTMYSHSAGTLAGTIARLCSHINDLLFLLNEKED